MDPARRDHGSIVIGWLTKLAVSLAVVGLMLFDGLAVGAAHLAATDDANQAAQAGAAEYRTSHDVQAAYQAAVESITSDSETLPAQQFVVEPDGTVQLALRRTITTLLVHRIGPLKKYAVVVEHGESSPPTL
jgi:hypothetical protein